MILKKHILTEKVVKGDNIYCFFVDNSANKIMVKNEIEKSFSVIVDKVNILNCSKKYKKVFLRKRYVEKVKGGQKKAYVYLKEGYSINFE